MDSFHLSALKVELNSVGSPELLLQTEFVTPEFVEFCKSFNQELIPLTLSFDTGFRGIRFFNTKDTVKNVLNISPSSGQVKDYTNFFNSETSKNVNKTLDVLGKAFHKKYETLKVATVKIEDHIQYTLNLDTKTRTITWEITHQSPEFTKFFAEAVGISKFTSTCFPEIRFRDEKLQRIYFKGTQSTSLAKYKYSKTESVSGYLKTFNEIKEAIEEGVQIFASKYKENICKLTKIRFIDEAVGKVILDLKEGTRFAVLSNNMVVALHTSNRYYGGRAISKSTLSSDAVWVVLTSDLYDTPQPELIEKGIIPKPADIHKCKFV